MRGSESMGGAPPPSSPRVPGPGPGSRILSVAILARAIFTEGKVGAIQIDTFLRKTMKRLLPTPEDTSANPCLLQHIGPIQVSRPALPVRGTISHDTDTRKLILQVLGTDASSKSGSRGCGGRGAGRGRPCIGER